MFFKTIKNSYWEDYIYYISTPILSSKTSREFKMDLLILRSHVIIFTFLQFVHSIQIYITNTEHISSNSTCEIDNAILYPCKRLEELSLKLDLLNGTLHITLLPGDYYIRDSFSLHFDSISNVYFKSWNDLGQVRIICDGSDFSLDYTNASIVSISNVEFYHCSGAVPTISTLAVSKVTIKYVNCTNSSVGCVKVNGVASDLNISHCIFKGSTNAVGVNITSKSLQAVYISDTVFENNKFGSLKLHSNINGGSVIITIERCVFAHNKAGYDSRGAAILLVGYIRRIYDSFGIKISHCQFLNNSADDGGAVVISDFHKIHINNSEFTNNMAYGSGGAIKLRGTTIRQRRREFIIEKCTFICNYTQNGGVIYIEIVTWSQTLHSIANSNFSNNNAAENGGAILTVKVTPHTINDEALHYIYATPTQHSFYINNVTFDNNLAENGGALYLNKANNITFINCNVNNNIGHHGSNISKGGAVAIIIEGISSAINIMKSKFSKNIADIGGALWISSFHSNLICIAAFMATMLSNLVDHCMLHA